MLTPERATVAPKLIFNQQLDGWLTVFFLIVVWTIVIDMLRGCWNHLSGRRPAPDTESPYVATQLT
jgi:carbon starvation protein